jgi:hypothetical protein
VANNALPATFDIRKALKHELGIETRIGATFGTVYCGVVGGVRRHEFAVMGAAVNLAARLMESKMNKGILVDEAVKAQADARFAFRTLPPVSAKGYDKPVAISEPLHAISSNKKKTPSASFTGRQEEKNEIFGIAKEILDAPTAVHSSVINLIGEAGMGKTALGVAVVDEIKLECLKRRKKVVATISTSTESEQRIPLWYVSCGDVSLELYNPSLMWSCLLLKLIPQDFSKCDSGAVLARWFHILWGRQS